MKTPRREDAKTMEQMRLVRVSGNSAGSTGPLVLRLWRQVYFVEDQLGTYGEESSQANQE